MSSNIGLLFENYNQSAAPVWIPGGVALALSIIYGPKRVLPGILLGAISISYSASLPFSTFLGFILGYLFEPIVATIFLNILVRDRFALKRPLHVFFFIMVGVIFSPFISNVINISSLYLGGVISLEKVPETWVQWFMGNALGILIFTPLILSFYRKLPRKINVFEALSLYLTLGIISYWSFNGEGFRKFMLIPFMTWAAIRFSYRGVSLAIILVGTIGIWESTVFWGFFQPSTPLTDLLWIQLFLAGMTTVGYFMATGAEADKRAQEKELELSIHQRNKEIAEEGLAILDQALTKSPIGFALLGRDFRFIRVNEALAKINGLPAELHLGRTVSEVLPATAEQIEEMILKVLATEEAVMNTPFSIPAPSDIRTRINGVISYYPVRHPLSKEIFAVGVSLQDLTDQLHTQKLLELNQERLSFAQEAGQIGTFEWDLDTNFIIPSPQLEKIYGLEQGEELTYERWVNGIHPEDLNSIMREFQKVEVSGKDFNVQFRIFTKAKGMRWLLARGKIVKEGEGHLKIIGINVDITDQKEIENKLRLTEANLLHALSIRDEFVATASHELKTPLTSLKLQTQMYQHSIEKNGTEAISEVKIHNFLDKNSRQIDRLTRLVDDMLDISRIRTGKLSLKKENCELSSILKDILLRTREQFEASGSGEPIIEELDVVNGYWDYLRVEQVVTNIITNAIRYGRGKPIHVSVTNSRDFALFRVTDHGLGIAKSDQEKIFERYERGLLSREVSGLGLGLFISQQIIKAHGGRIWVESELNQGSTFYVELPKIKPSVLIPSETRELILVGN